MATPELPPELGTFVELELELAPEDANDPVDDEAGVDDTLMLLDEGECDDVSELLGLVPLDKLSKLSGLL